MILGHLIYTGYLDSGARALSCAGRTSKTVQKISPPFCKVIIEVLMRENRRMSAHDTARRALQFEKKERYVLYLFPSCFSAWSCFPETVKIG